MKFEVKKAVREKIYAKVALMGASGSGKSYSSLKLATGMADEIERETGKRPKILMGNSEAARGRYYANEFDYDIVDMVAPHAPENYVDLINFAVQQGYGILIIDSTSAEWEGKGGCLDLQKQAGGRYQDWAKITPRHNKFINTLSDSPIHIIATMRGKDQYVMSQSEGYNGKTTTKVEKVGVGAKQREGFEYEFTCTFLLDVKTNTAETQKDNTHIFENEGAILLSENHGSRIIQWANSGDAQYIPPKRSIEAKKSEEVKKQAEEDKSKLQSVIKEIDATAREKAKVDKDKVVEAIKKYHTSANYNSIKDITVANNILKELKEIK